MRVLVCHALRQDSRLTTIEHALCFARHLDGCEVTYVNIFGRIDKDLPSRSFDIVVLTYELMSLRSLPFWQALSRRLSDVLKTSSIRIVMPQDDYSCSELIDDFVVEHNIHHVFTPLTRDLQMLYPKSLAQGVLFHEALTGYWESNTNLPINKFRLPFRQRELDLGQRVRFLPPHFGDVAQRKGQLAIEFADMARAEGFRCDVSTEAAATLVGESWWKFLGNSRFTVGRRGGASIADPRGRLHSKFTQLQLRKPSMSLYEIARRMNLGTLPKGDFSAISPRLFECAAMGVCQILEEGDYVEDFVPWRDYIPLASDLSNTGQVFSAMRDLDFCEEIAKNAERVLIQSEKFSYRQFVKNLMKVCVGYDIEGRASADVQDLDEALFSSSSLELVTQVKSAARQRITWKRSNESQSINLLAQQWIDAFFHKQLVVESLTMPWIAAKPLLASS